MIKIQGKDEKEVKRTRINTRYLREEFTIKSDFIKYTVNHSLIQKQVKIITHDHVSNKHKIHTIEIIETQHEHKYINV